MKGRKSLERLCAVCRLATTYRDEAGQCHQVEYPPLKELLSALGVAADTEAVRQEHLVRIESAKAKRILPPVQVVREGNAPFGIEVRHTALAHQQHYAWVLQLEDGGRQQGRFCLAELNSTGDNPRHSLLLLPEVPPQGYHRFALHTTDAKRQPLAEMLFIVAPAACYQPESLQQGQRSWGYAVQLYALRSTRNWGIGDFTDLLRVLDFAAHSGAGMLSLNPLHALFPGAPTYCNPELPSTRLFLNILYLDVEAIPDLGECREAQERIAEEAFQARLRALRAKKTVDYAAVAAVKLEILGLLYTCFRSTHMEHNSEYATQFRQFCAEQGDELSLQTLYEALQVWLVTEKAQVQDWLAWPKPFRAPTSATVAAFGAEHEEQVTFYAYLQWQAWNQLAAAGDRAFRLGLPVGLCQELAGEVARGGGESWGQQELFALKIKLGASPGAMCPQRYYTDSSPWRPDILEHQGYAPFIRLLRQNMRFAGALHIDLNHLLQPYWIARDSAVNTGTYAQYSTQDMLGILALESQRNRCLVIGAGAELIQDELSKECMALGILDYRSFYIEKVADGGFKAPAQIAEQTLLTATTATLPTLAAYWQGLDLEEKGKLGPHCHGSRHEQRIAARAADRAFLLMALKKEQLLPPDLSVQPISAPEMTLELALAFYRYLVRTPARLLSVYLEDIFGQSVQISLPGCTAECSDWRHKLSLELELWSRDPRVQAFVAALGTERAPAPETDILWRRMGPTVPDIPRSTYRLQFQRDFTFDHALEVLPFLHQLGISHCYASPCLQARPGSAHGYDIIDHNAINSELGGAPAFARFVSALRQREMGLILDMVPNHMGIMGSDNSYWLDVLENGPAARYAAFFDIDWAPLKKTLKGKVLVPVLGDHYGNVLESGGFHLRLDSERGAFSVFYFEHEFPIDPREYPRILTCDIARLEEILGHEDQRLLEFQSLATAFANLPSRQTCDKKSEDERRRDKEVHKAGLARLLQDADIAYFVNETIELFNSKEGIDLLHDLLENQAWRVSYWRVASDEINYRRFFDINELAGLRMENPDVFSATHALILDAIARGDVQGLRIDHPDGLYDPAGYFNMLQSQVASPLPNSRRYNDNPSAQQRSTPERPLYVLVEKILIGHEPLRQNWAVYGTTGYDFANLVNGLFVDADAEAQMSRIYADFVAQANPLQETVYHSRKLIMRTALSSELNVLAQQLSRIAEMDRHTCDFTLNNLHDTLREIVATFPVYRTYIQSDSIQAEDIQYINEAVTAAKRKTRETDNSVFDFVREVLTLEIAAGKSSIYRQQVITFALKFQQYTGPVMAKGLEDTAFYRYNRLLSLNEVGGAPQRFGVSVATFHAQNQQRAENWPHAMLSSSTHDSKRSEDVRARINVLSEMADKWHTKVQRWSQINRSEGQNAAEERGRLEPNDEYFLYQTLVGVWPQTEPDAEGLQRLCSRVNASLLKAGKEAKLRTSWATPDPDYEGVVSTFVTALFRDPANNPFLKDFLPFQQLVSRVGLFNILAQTLLKLTAPGVPDIYQGNELLDFSLVDPDNRRPVDYRCRIELLDQLKRRLAAGEKRSALARELLQYPDGGGAKLYLTWRSLQLRSAHPELFRHGNYMPLTLSGIHAEHLCAYARSYKGMLVLTLVPRLIYRLAGGKPPLGENVWGETWVEVPYPRWENWLTGQALNAEAHGEVWRLPIGRTLCDFPVALLCLSTDKFLPQPLIAADPNPLLARM